MKNSLFLISALLLASLPAFAQQPSSEPLRNTFVTASETVIDTATAIDVKASPSVFDAQMKNLKAIKANLDTMADSDQERDVSSALSDMIFTVSACHIQAVNGTGTSKCQTQFDHARDRAMISIGKHKQADTWVDGPPS